MGVPIWGLFLTAAVPVVKVLLLCSVGVLLAHLGILDSKGRQVLGAVVFWVFVPALSFVKLAGGVNLANLQRWWLIPANQALSVALGAAVGLLTARATRTPARFRTHVTLATSLGNVGNLPMVLAAALCSDAAAPFRAALGPGCQDLSYAYIAFGMWVGSTFQFTIAYAMLRLPPALLPQHAQLAQQPALPGGGERAAAEGGKVAQRGGSEEGGELLVLVAPGGPLGKAQDASTALDAQQEHTGQQGALAPLPSGMSGGLRLAPAVELQPQPQGGNTRQVAVTSAGGGSGSSLVGQAPSRSLPAEAAHGDGGGIGGDLDGPGSEDDSEQERLLSSQQTSPSHAAVDGDPVAGSSSQGGLGKWQPAWLLLPDWLSGRDASRGKGSTARVPGSWGLAAAAERAVRQWRRRREPPARAWQVAGIPLKDILNLPTLSAIIGLVWGCIPPAKALLFGSPGGGAAPLGFLTDVINTLADAMIPCVMLVMGSVLYKGPGASKLPARVIVGVVCARLLLLPACGTLVVWGGRRLGLYAPLDPMFMFIMFINHTTPTAINMQTVATMHQNGEAEMSAMLFWQYVAALITLPCWIALQLQLVV